MKKKVNPGILPGFANLTHPKILTSSELENYMESDSWFEQRFNTIFCSEESQSVHMCSWMCSMSKSQGRSNFWSDCLPSDTVGWERLSWRLGILATFVRVLTSFGIRQGELTAALVVSNCHIFTFWSKAYSIRLNVSAGTDDGKKTGFDRSVSDFRLARLND